MIEYRLRGNESVSYIDVLTQKLRPRDLQHQNKVCSKEASFQDLLRKIYFQHLLCYQIKKGLETEYHF